MTKIVAISGSLRRRSFNTALAEAAREAVPEGCTLTVATLHGIPLYDGDLEVDRGVPAAVEELKEQVASADAMLLVTPEYNQSLPGVLKNALDWMTRPPADITRVFKGRAVGLIGATPGGRGTALAQTAWLPVLRALGTRPYFGTALYVSGASRVFDERGVMRDEDLNRRLRAYVSGLANFAKAGDA